MVVVAAVVERADQTLVTQRLAGTHLGGHWEFPGGKLEDGENHLQCLEREMREELDVEVEVGNELHTTSFDYPERTVELHFYRCAVIGEPKPVLGQQIRWVSRAELTSLRFPPADLELIRLLAKRRPLKPSGRRSAAARTDGG